MNFQSPGIDCHAKNVDVETSEGASAFTEDCFGYLESKEQR